MINYIIVAVALLLSGISGFYSITGLMAIFPAATIPIILMGGGLEVAKIASTVWLHMNWTKEIVGKFIRNYIAAAVAVLILITSMGVFGFLSKAHLEQQAVQNTVQVSADRIASQMDTLTTRIHIIEDNNKQINAAINSQIANDHAGTALRNRAKLHTEEQANEKQLSGLYTQLDDLKQQKITADQATQKVALEVGPIKYIAELIFNSNSQDTLEKAVRFVILLIIFVFDPLALLLMIAGTAGIRKSNEEVPAPEPEEPPKKAIKKKPEPKTFELPHDDVTPMVAPAPIVPPPTLRTTAHSDIVTTDKPITVDPHSDMQERRRLNLGAVKG